MPEPLLTLEHLTKYFPLEHSMGGRHQGGTVRALDGVSFSVEPGETFGLVGESGCGKSTLGLTVLQLYRPTAGKVLFEGQNLAGLTEQQLKPVRKKLQMIFQDPYASLDPRMTVGGIVQEPLDIHRIGDREERRARVRELLGLVGLNENHIDRYPHEFSGGQRQRIGIARAIALNPRLVICDEPVSALDVSIQVQVLNLLRDLQQNFKLTYLFIAHNLAVVAHISDRIGVMYLGKLIETGPTAAITDHPRHPYTQSLLSAVPEIDRRRQKKRIQLTGDVPSPVTPPSGCRFHPRCPIAKPNCTEQEPPLEQKESGHWVACHYA
ncbi:MAG: dipeptide ABC transporter ATP-binding protein [candidate division Zixibacteria bacterium]|nr:dipeptide ABC transporter ATP-binding protein [candidate division Zixibacteria bacterium]